MAPDAGAIDLQVDIRRAQQIERHFVACLSLGLSKGHRRFQVLPAPAVHIVALDACSGLTLHDHEPIECVTFLGFTPTVSLALGFLGSSVFDY